MTGPASTQPTYHRPADVARALRCSQWWIKEQARNHRIPYSWIGGSYLFTDEHITEIIRLFEVRPVEPATTTGPRATRRPVDKQDAPVVQLHARTPRRARIFAAQIAA